MSAKYILKRIGISLFTLLAILLILFILLELMPGSPFNDEKLTQEQLDLLFHKYGLDKPLIVRFGIYVKNMLTGDFGVSYVLRKNMPITTMLGSRIITSMRIGLQALLVGLIFGLILGISAALHQNSPLDTGTTLLSLIGASVPSYVFALLLSYIFAFRLKIFPLFYSTHEEFLSSILPTIALGMSPIASIARFSRTEMIEVMDSEYITLAEAKGIRRMPVIIKHALRNALIPILTVVAPIMVSLMTGSTVVETIFSVPGIGSLFVEAIQVNDYNVVIALSFLLSVMYIGVMLIVDILYGIIDPRIRVSGGSSNA